MDRYQEYIRKEEATHLIMIQEFEKEVMKQVEIKYEIKLRLLNTHT